ncbi:MAG: NAD-dependent epimerase/dehydratase family protein [Anaerolineae bacterium]|nr:NAD-dependent epimerase/dehydratase family protein [Anaerolineae bacterium]
MDQKFSGKQVLVTGGAGFVGSNLVRRLIAEGAKVTVVDDFFTGSLSNLFDLDGKYELVRGSVTDKDLVATLVKQMNFVFHLAARNIIASTKNPYEDFQTNIGGTLNILLAAREFLPERVVYSSSASVYGNPIYLPINEDDKINLLTPYAASKYGGEGYCQAFYESYGVSVSVVRYSNVYGIGQDPRNPYCGVVAKFMEKASKRKPVEIHGDGQQTRDFTFVEDAVEATILAALSPRADGEVFNVGTGVETSVYTLAKEILSLYQIDAEPSYVDRRDIDNIRRRVVNVEKIRRKLKWVSRFTVREGLRRTLHWFQESR